jgi:hypothetical protein
MKGALMEYIVVLDCATPIGDFMLSARGKIGGATGVFDALGKQHPYLIARDLDMKAPAFVAMTHLRNPGEEDPQPAMLVVPAASVLAVVPVPAAQTPAAKQTQPEGRLH